MIKETQSAFFFQSTKLNFRGNNLKSIIQNPLSIFHGKIQPMEWVCVVINSILSDKICFDLLDSVEQRPKSTMQDFIIQWFLNRFGCKNVAEILMKDFLISLKEYATKSERFQINLFF